MNTVTIHPHPVQAREFFEEKMAFTTGPVELERAMKEGEVTIIDVRAAEDYRKGHIPGAINLPKEKWDTPVSLSRDKPNVVYCYTQTCHLAAAAALEFATQGYPVKEMEGGFEAWKNAEMPVESPRSY